MLLKRSNKYFVPVVSVILALLSAMSPFATDTYLPAMPDMAKAFGVGINKVQLTITLYFLGFAVGNFIGGPLSDAFGRKRIAVIGIMLYGLSAFLITFATSIEMIWILRFTQAFGGGFGTVTAMVFVKDWFKGRQVAKMATIIGMIMMLAPLFAPIIGTLLIKNNSWPSVFWFLCGFALLLLILVGIILTESRDQSLITKHITSKQFFEKYIAFFHSRKAVFMLIILSFAFGGMLVFITGASYLYISHYEFEIGLFPILFGANVSLNILLSFLNTVLLKKHKPENLLRVGLALQLIAGITLAVISITSELPPFYIIFPAIILYVGSLGLIFGNGTAVILNLLPEISGSANATIGISRFLTGFIVSSIPAFFPEATFAAITITMFCSTLIANIFGYVFIKQNNN